MKNQFSCSCATLFFTLLFFSCQNPDTTPGMTAVPPNVLLIMTDDQGYGDLACHGNAHINTPNLDKLFAQSVRLTDFHVGTTCAPTRAGLLTGRNCNRAGVWHTIAGRSQLRASEMTMADVFAHNRYRTGMFGKWHLGDNYPFRPHDRGFQEVLYHGGGGVMQQPDYWNNTYFDDTYFRNGKAEQQKGYCTDVWFDAAIQFMARPANQPFFCYLATNAPHGPFHVDSSYIRPYLGNERVPNPNFHGMITNFDENMGRLMAKLDEMGLTDNTILIYLTDNGTAAGAELDEEGRVVKGYNAGMRGKKGSEYEGGHRVPCFIRWPARNIEGGEDVNLLTAHLDLLPTLIDWLELKTPKDVHFDGRSLASLLRGDKSDDDWHQRVLITDTQRAETPVKWKKSATMMDKWRLINGTELYNIKSDPGQQQDVASLHPDILSRLRSAYESWWAELQPTFSEPTRTVLGAPGVGEIVLFSHDWHEAENNQGQPNLNGAGGHVVPWNQMMIRNGMLVNGYWEVEVAEKGLYDFELRRWPREAARALTAGAPPLVAVPGGREITAGKALSINRARIRAGDREQVMEVPKETEHVTFTLDLEHGPQRIKTWLEGPGQTRLGAYYVYITKN